MIELERATLLLVGRRLVADGDRFYVQDQHWSLVSGLAEAFIDAVYVSFARPIESVETERLVAVDESLVTVKPNHEWAGASSPAGRLTSLRRDRRAIQELAGPVVSYTFLPGVYSFLLSPVVFSRGELNVTYFGTESFDAAGGEDGGPVYGPARRLLYGAGQRYVLRSADVAFVRDARMLAADVRADVRQSRPVTKFDEADVASGVDPALGDTVELLFVASFREVKGHEHLLEALALLDERGDASYRLRLVGDGETRPQVEARTRELGLEGVVEFAGHVERKDRLLEAYRSADVFVLPSLSEGFPRVLDEAMAAGLPVVATRVGGIPAVLEDCESALLVDPGDPEALASAVERVVADRALRERLARSGLEAASARLEGSPVDQHLAAIEANLPADWPAEAER